MKKRQDQDERRRCTTTVLEKMVSQPCLKWRWVVLILVFMIGFVAAQIPQMRKPMMHQRYFNLDSSRMSIANMTCHFFEQPLNHFIPRGTGPTYQQRYCLYDGFVRNESGTAPLFLYTGNESPIEQYINHTGLMWQLAPQHNAQVVFVEHRYEGQSLPLNLSKVCMSYASSIQALADYVKLLQHINPDSSRPTIAFGGSYGGMLSSWLRMKYPNMVAGAIAASAPIWGLPTKARPDALDATSRVISRGIRMPYPPTKRHSNASNHCGTNVLATWPLIKYLGKSVIGREFLTNTFRLCKPLMSEDIVDEVLDWAQSPWFDMAEGSFPYPSSYLPFSLHMGKNDLPPWPIQAACWKESDLHRDWGVSFDYINASDVRYSVTYGDSGIVLDVDWDKVSPSGASISHGGGVSLSGVAGLLTSMRNAVAVWFNITHDLMCFNITPAYNDASESTKFRVSYSADRTFRSMSAISDVRGTPASRQSNASALCIEKMKNEGSWPSLSCNDDISMPKTLARGLGHDVYWPPNFPRGIRTYADVVTHYESGCDDPHGIFGYPLKADPWGEWLDLYYGGQRIGSHSNIVFSNGLLDPWSSGGVYAKDPTVGKYQGPMVQNITSDGSIVALIIEFGGHHTDLMYSDPRDPQCVRDARKIENDFISRWIREWVE